MAKRKRTSTEDAGSDDRIEQAYAQALRTYSHRSQLTGIDKGYKYSDGEQTSIISIRFHINEKIGLENLSPAEIFPRDILGVPTDVIEATYVPHRVAEDQLMARRRRVDTLQPGISVGHPDVTAGTLGALVYDNATGRPCILSNWHVLVGSATARPGDPIVQPGPSDSGRPPRDTIALLDRSILGAQGDAAIATLTGMRAFTAGQFETNKPIQAARMPRLGEVLEKSGRTTGVTRARVDGVGRFFITYSVGRVGVDGFKLVPVLDDNPDDEEISSGGDSGSLWYSAESDEGVGLHFGGEVDPDPKAENALACNLPTVLRELDVTLAPPVTALEPSAAVATTSLAAPPMSIAVTPTNGHANGVNGDHEGITTVTRAEHSLGRFDIDVRVRIQPRASAVH